MRDKTYFTHPYTLLTHGAQPMARAQTWLRARNIVSRDERLQANTFFAITVAAEAFTHLLGNFSREYFIERLEHAVGKIPSTGAYPRMSLGPDQRFASKGCYIVQLANAPGNGFMAVSDWIIP